MQKRHFSITFFSNILKFFILFLFLGILSLAINTPHAYASGWTQLGLSGQYVPAIAVDPTNSNIIYAATGTGVHKSTNGGSTWNTMNSGLPSGSIQDLVINPSTPNILYALASGTGVYKSIDSGANWSFISPSITSFVSFQALAIDPNNSNTVYVGIYGNCGGLWKTTDGGSTWTQHSPNCDITGVAVDSISSAVYAGGNSEYKSTNGGSTWTASSGFSAGGGTGSVTIDPNNHNIIYAGGGGGSQRGAYKSTDGGLTYTYLSSYPGAGTNIGNGLLTTDPVRSDTIYGSASTGIGIAYKSTDGGSTWTNITSGLPSDSGSGIARLYVPTNNPNILYAGTGGDGIYTYALTPPVPTPTPTPSPDTISLSLSTSTITVGQPFSTTVVVSGGQAFNAAKATVSVSSNLTVNGIQSAPSPECNMNYTKSPTTSDPSFAGAIYGSSSTNCNVYTITLTPNAVGTGTITFTNAQIKAYVDNSDILSGVTNGSFTINPAPSPTGTTTQTIDDSVQGSVQNQWNYVGTGWGHCTSCDETNPTVSFYGASQSWDKTVNDFVTITFTGVQFKLYGVTDPRDGIGAVSIDGGAETNVDFYSSTRTGNVLLWTSPILSNSSHTVKLRVTGTHNNNATDNYIILDRGDILATGTLSNLSVNTYPTDTYASTLTISGTKDSSITTVYINGDNSNVTYPTSTTWQATISLPALGDNQFIIYGKDVNNNQTASISITIKKHTLGDINGDGVIDLTDASLFAIDYGKTSNLTYPLSDMNSDGSVDLTDLSILAKLLPQ